MAAGSFQTIRKTLFWLIPAALLVSLWVLRGAREEVKAARETLEKRTQELERLRADTADIERVRAQADEMVRLRNENQELHRLRNEVRQLREERQSLTQASQSARAQASQLMSNQVSVRQLQDQLRAAQAQNADLSAQNTLFQQLRSQTDIRVCVRNLQIIEGAKDQWALENRKATGELPGPEDLLPYVRNNTFPPCPGGGAYTINAIGAGATCSIEGHALPQQ